VCEIEARRGALLFFLYKSWPLEVHFSTSCKNRGQERCAAFLLVRIVARRGALLFFLQALLLARIVRVKGILPSFQIMFASCQAVRQSHAPLHSVCPATAAKRKGMQLLQPHGRACCMDQDETCCMDQDEICCMDQDGICCMDQDEIYVVWTRMKYVVWDLLFPFWRGCSLVHMLFCTGCLHRLFAQVVLHRLFAQVVLHRLFCTGCFAQVGSLVHRLFAQVVLEPWRLGVGVRGQARANTQRQCTAAAESSSTTGTHSAA